MTDLGFFARFLLGMRCFFALVFAARLPGDAQKMLPAPEPAKEIVKEVVKEREVIKSDPQAVGKGAIAVLAMLQREGRLIDFLQESIDDFADAQIGAAVRDIHRGCRKALVEHFALEPIRAEAEESKVTIAAGFDASAIRLVGEVAGKPPFTGTLRHAGWRAGKLDAPTIPDGHDATVIAPAEVEIA